MGYASRSGRARTSRSSPKAFAVCDRCAMWYNHYQLKWQFDWAGASLVNRRLLVCDRCYDEPQEQLRSIIITADPVPIVNPRVEPYAWDEIDRRQVSGYNEIDPATGIPIVLGDTRVTTNNSGPTNDPRVTQQTGAPSGSKNQMPGTDPNAVTFRNVTNVENNGIGFIRVSITTTNGMKTGQYVKIQEVDGVSNANGDFYITVINDNQFDLQGALFSGVYVSGGYVINEPALPYGFDQVPRTGPL